MEPQYAVQDDIEYDALRHSVSGSSSRGVHATFHAGAILAPAGVTMTPEFFPLPEGVHELCGKYGTPYLMLSGTQTELSEFLRFVYVQCEGKTGQEDRDCFLNALNTSEQGAALTVHEFNTTVTAMQAPAIGKYPSNIPDHGQAIWDSVITLPTFKRASQGQPVEVKWAIAVKMYTERALKVGAKPFTGSKAVYTRKDLTDDTNRVLASVGSLEQQLRNNLLRKSYITDFGGSAPWRFVGTGYNNSNFVIELERQWSLLETGPKILGYLVRTEGFKKNIHGAGYILPISRSALLRVRVRKNSGQVTVNLFLMFTKDKIVHTYELPGKTPIRELLQHFDDIAKRWYKTKRF